MTISFISSSKWTKVGLKLDNSTTSFQFLKIRSKRVKVVFMSLVKKNGR